MERWMIDIHMRYVGGGLRVGDFTDHDLAQFKSATAFGDRIMKRRKGADDLVTLDQGECAQVIANKPVSFPLVSSFFAREVRTRVSWSDCQNLNG
jgi:hypothetical protein